MVVVAFYGTLWMRLGTGLDYYDLSALALWIGSFLAVSVFVFWFSGLYRGIWRYASMSDLVAIVRAVTIATLIYLAIMFLFTRLELLPRAVPLINWIVLICLLGGPRFIYRILKDRKFG